MHKFFSGNCSLGLEDQLAIACVVESNIQSHYPIDNSLESKLRELMCEFVIGEHHTEDDVLILSEVAVGAEVDSRLEMLIHNGSFKDFNLGVSGKTIQRFINKTTAPSPNTIQNIALFVCLTEIKVNDKLIMWVSPDELFEHVSNNSRIIAAEYLQHFLKGYDNACADDISSFNDIYLAQKTTNKVTETIGIKVLKTESGYLQLSEARIARHEESQDANIPITVSKGWSCLNGFGALVCVFRVEDEPADNHIYSEIASDFEPETDNQVNLLALFRSRRSFLIGDIENFSLSSENLVKHLNTHIFEFKRKEEQKLTKSLLLDDTNIMDADDVLSVLHSLRFKKPATQEKGHTTMDKVEQARLNRKMVDAFYGGNQPLLCETLAQGADLNCRNGSILRNLWSNSPLETIEHYIGMCQHEVNYLARDSKGRLMSERCLQMNHPVVYFILRDREIKAGAKQGIYPGKRKNKPLSADHCRPVADFEKVNPADAPKHDDPFYSMANVLARAEAIPYDL